MIVEQSRRGFVGALVAGVAAMSAAAALRFAGDDETGGHGLISVSTDAPAPVPSGVGQADGVWQRAVGSTVAVIGETGTVAGRIFDVWLGADGGERPDTVRPRSLTVFIEVDAANAPAGDRIYGIRSDEVDVRELFLSRGEDVLGKAILYAILN